MVEVIVVQEEFNEEEMEMVKIVVWFYDMGYCDSYDDY